MVMVSLLVRSSDMNKIDFEFASFDEEKYMELLIKSSGIHINNCNGKKFIMTGLIMHLTWKYCKV